MNPLTQVKRTQQINLKEASLGISEEASWHSKFRDSAYVFVGGIPFDLTEGDLLAVFAQYGEVVDVNLVRDKSTGKSRGFAFLAYEDQRSTILAVDNLNGAKILGRIVRVDHVSKYKKKEEEDEDEDERNRKREARGVCRAFQRGECTRGDSCKFSHDQQRAANTGWGSQDAESRWAKRTGDFPEESSRGRNKRREEINTDFQGKDGAAGGNKRREETNTDSHVRDGGTSRVDGDGAYKVHSKDEKSMRAPDPKRKDKFPESQGRESGHRNDGDGRTSERQTMRERSEAYSGNRERERQERKDRYSSSYDHEEDEREHRRRSRG